MNAYSYFVRDGAMTFFTQVAALLIGTYIIMKVNL